jgi:mannose-6-phosphate isomerase-like protein (cupin superfamily)
MHSNEIAVRPWGNYQKFHQEPGVWVKRIEVNPGGRLSLQKHKHRSEKWIVVAGEGLAIVNDEKFHVSNGSVIDVPCGAIHRIGNTSDKPLVMIEVACGEILTEEDIIRLQDDYAR